MTERTTTEARRQRIIAAALELLATTPPERLSPRQVARRLRISLPAVLWHFRSRDQLLSAVIQHCRAELGDVAAAVLTEGPTALATLEAYLSRLLDYLGQHPALVRLLAVELPTDAARVALRQLTSMQTNLLAELVRQGQAGGELLRTLDPSQAATLLVGLALGLAVQRKVGLPEASKMTATELLRLWVAGIGAAPDDVAPAPAIDLPGVKEGDGMFALDVRPVLAAGTDPLELILGLRDAVGPGGVLKLVAPFRPAPLIALLEGRGDVLKVGQLDHNTWSMEVIVGGQPSVEDLRQLEPPEPLERVLRAAQGLAPGAVYLARLPRYPRMLVPRLQQHGLSWAVHEERDGSALLRLVRPL